MFSKRGYSILMVHLLGETSHTNHLEIRSPFVYVPYVLINRACHPAGHYWNWYPDPRQYTGFPQKSQKKVPWFFHDFSRPKSKFPDKKNPTICFCGPCMYQIVDRQTQDAHSHTDTHMMICSWPTDYSTDFTSNWTDSRSQNYTC